MAPTPLIQIGRPLAMVENLVYATPVRRCIGLVDPAATALEGSMEVDGTFAAFTIAADGTFENIFPFIRTPDPDCTILFRA